MAPLMTLYPRRKIIKPKRRMLYVKLIQSLAIPNPLSPGDCDSPRRCSPESIPLTSPSAVSLGCFREIIRWSRLLTQPHQRVIGTIPFDPTDDARRRGRHFRASEPITRSPTPSATPPPLTTLVVNDDSRYLLYLRVDPLFRAPARGTRAT